MMAVEGREAQRVRDLVRLAVDSGASDAEGRTAAMAACKLIARHELQILPRGALPQPKPYTPPPYPSPYTYQPPRPRPSSPGEKSRVIRAKYASACRTCHEQIDVGEQCVWSKGGGVAHVACGGGR